MVNRSKSLIVLSDEEREELLALARKGKSSQSGAIRARIILECAHGMTGELIAQKLGIWPQTVSKWRGRFAQHRLKGLEDAPRPGAPVKVDEHEVAAILRTTLKQPPSEGARWTTRSLAREAGLSQTTISKVWRKFGVHPGKHISFNLSADPTYPDRLQDVVGLYIDPKCSVLALCVDPRDRKPVRDWDDVLPGASPGSEKSTTLSKDLGRVSAAIASNGRRGQARQLQAFLNALHANIPQDLNIDLMVDTGGAELGLMTLMWFMRHPRVNPRYTPNLVTWLAEARSWVELVAHKQAKLRMGSLHGLQQVLRQARVSSPPQTVFRWVSPGDDLRLLLTKFDLLS